MQHFLDVDVLTQEVAHALFERAFSFKAAKTYPHYPHINVLHVFYEDSTRTSLSFNLAAEKLGLKGFHLDPRRSSEMKGESLIDTLNTVSALGIDLLVMRHPEDDIFQRIRASIPTNLKLVNAGAGMYAHPTQAMLDIMTMLECGVVLSHAKIVVVGDIVHSRVAKSLQRLCAILGVQDLVFTGPAAFLPDSLIYGRMTDSLQEALTDADVVMALRVQRERLSPQESLGLATYHRHYAITERTLAYAKPNAWVMHPGPMNRGVEIDSAVADGHQSCILKQVQNGVFMRMAILESLLLTQA